MKKLLLLTFICLVGLYACKKSDNSPPTNATKIVGKWANSKIEYVKTKNGVDSLAAQNPPDSLYLQFNANLTGVIAEDGSNQACNYTLSGSTLSLTAINSPSSSVNFNVRSLTSTDMVLRLQSDEEDGAIYNIDYYFTKQ